MAYQIQRNRHTIDADGRVLGRLASEIALLLMGKNKANYMPHVDNGDFVEIHNVAKMKITGDKLRQKLYRHYSGYPGGLKETTLGVRMQKQPQEVLRNAVIHMLPKNRLRSLMIKRLIVKF